MGRAGLPGVQALGKAADDVGIDDRSPVGAAGVLPAGGVIVRAARLFQSGVVGNHRVDAAGGHAPEQARLPETGDIHIRFRVGLGDDPNAVAGVEQHFPDDGGTDKGAVDVGIAGHQDDVERIPAQAFHFCGGGGEEHGVIIV